MRKEVENHVDILRGLPEDSWAKNHESRRTSIAVTVDRSNLPWAGREWDGEITGGAHGILYYSFSSDESQ